MRYCYHCFILLLWLFVQSLAVLASASCPPDNQYAFPDCQYDWRTHDLWCCGTNFTKIPEPESHLIKAQAHPKYSFRLFHNRTCLNEVNSEQVGRYMYLKVLNVADNQIEQIPEGTFVNNKRLITLNLADNNLTDFSEEAFPEGNRLQVLILSDNPISDMPEFSEDRYSKLKLVQIQNTDVSSLSISDIAVPGMLTMLPSHPVSILKGESGHLVLLCGDNRCPEGESTAAPELRFSSLDTAIEARTFAQDDQKQCSTFIYTTEKVSENFVRWDALCNFTKTFKRNDAMDSGYEVPDFEWGFDTTIAGKELTREELFTEAYISMDTDDIDEWALAITLGGIIVFIAASTLISVYVLPHFPAINGYLKIRR